MHDFGLLADLLPEPMLLVSSRGTIMAANRAAAEAMGVAARALPGRALTEIATDRAERVEAYLRACSRSRELLPGTLTLSRAGTATSYRASGALYALEHEERLVLLRLTPKDAAVNRFLLLNTQLEQLNEELRRRRQFQASLYEQHERLRVTLASIGDGVIATDATGRITLINPTAERLTGWRQSEALGLPSDAVFRLVSEQTRAPVESPIAKVLLSGLAVGLANHTVLVRKDGSEVPIADSGAAIRDQSGTIVGAVLVFRDVTEERSVQHELKLRASQLEEADRRKDEYLAMLAHELRNPLAPLRNAIHVLQIGGSGGRHAPEMLAVMGRQVEHLARLVGDLLDVSRITRGKIQLQLEPLDLRQVMPRAVELVRPMVQARGQRLAIELAPVPIPVMGDSDRLVQVVSNLLNNAAKYTQEGGRIDLECAKDARLASITVRDNGIGIPPELLPRIFDLFTQGDTSIERTFGGLGVGLTLVRALIEQHGGAVRAYSAGPGKGSVFRVELPLIAERA